MFGKLISYLKSKKTLLFLIILGSVALRLINLNYNSPSNDEAVYISVGHSILYNWDWTVYNTASWLGGHSYFYPIISSLAYTFSGIMGSRFVNVIFGGLYTILAYKFIYQVSFYLTKREEKSQIAGLIGTLLITFSSVFSYVSRLATYDMISFTLLLAGIYLITTTFREGMFKEMAAKSYFISFILLTAAFLFKYIAFIYLPFIIAFFTYFIKKNLDKKAMYLWKFYFVYPIILFLGVFTLLNFRYLYTFGFNQINRESVSFIEILRIFLLNSLYILPIGITAFVKMFSKKNWKFLIIATISTLLPIIFHLVFKRSATADKHTFLVLLPLSLTAGLAFSDLFKDSLKKKLATAVIVLFVGLNYWTAQKYNSIWPNYNSGISYLFDNLNVHDKLLTEMGSGVLVSTSSSVNPKNVITFDWFVYNDKEGTKAYKEAVENGYFTYIELDKNPTLKTNTYLELSKEVVESMDDNYKVVFSNSDIEIYKRAF